MCLHQSNQVQVLYLALKDIQDILSAQRLYYVSVTINQSGDFLVPLEGEGGVYSVTNHDKGTSTTYSLIH